MVNADPVIMRIQVMSDIHLEQWQHNQVARVEELDVGAETLVLAGDILYLKELYWVQEILGKFCEKWKTVIYTPGNHEFYTSDPKTCWNNLLIAKMGLSNLHVLDLGKVEIINGRRWIGGTMWFPHQPDNPCYSGLLNDFYLIKDFVPWVYEQCDQTVHNLKVNMEPGDIVVTHHLPSTLSIHPQYKTSSLNRFFLCDMSELILEREPALWLHGHSHESSDYVLGKTRVVANPRGYFRERRASAAFDYNLIIDV